MKFTSYIANRLQSFSLDCKIENEFVVLTIDGTPIKIRIDDEWEQAYQQYKTAKSITFDTTTRILCHNKAVEVPLMRLDQEFYRDLQYLFTDSSGNTVSISRSTAMYSFAHFDSDEYPKYFERVVKRRITGRSRTSFPINALMTNPFTATYTAKSRKKPSNLFEKSISKIKACLFKLAVEQRDCLEIWKAKDQRCLPLHTDNTSDDFSIPKAEYEDNVVSYYKVARSSPFPSQSFLDYFHVLEYHFLRVTEDKLHHQIRTMVYQTNFRANEDGLDRIIALVRSSDAINDETEMLRSVIQKFVPEHDFISYLKSVEDDCGHKIYTKKRKIFGEHLEISTAEGHAISNAAKVLKHIRNAIVHSSDRYKREDCHIPLSESENVIEEFIPIIRYFAEKVIYGTAN
ncbi:hypothetical protein F6V30_16360 [Oryzomonas sagensis]|uniref:ApeA N-terminal domain-containing protein n=1 Tax=Oryzomonas sagensis TaxID=2603857 RepID=A0ABQ6TK48_9BACT|nr:hypothetical protein [Oryzomonas sagensis]KAB0668360.1 hypothetical protein F6V30_16360 [Oryzomonas sagensis]